MRVVQKAYACFVQRADAAGAARHFLHADFTLFLAVIAMPRWLRRHAITPFSTRSLRHML
jgi:hypothetical protein